MDGHADGLTVKFVTFSWYVGNPQKREMPRWTTEEKALLPALTALDVSRHLGQVFFADVPLLCEHFLTYGYVLDV